jgi:hypothetical protein
MANKVCPKCGKNMIRKYRNLVLTSMPPQYPWIWWCACGHEERGGVDAGVSQRELDMNRWKEANKQITNGDPAAGI